RAEALIDIGTEALATGARHGGVVAGERRVEIRPEEVAVVGHEHLGRRLSAAVRRARAGRSRTRRGEADLARRLEVLRVEVVVGRELAIAGAAPGGEGLAGRGTCVSVTRGGARAGQLNEEEAQERGRIADLEARGERSGLPAAAGRAGAELGLDVARRGVGH